MHREYVHRPVVMALVASVLAAQVHAQGRAQGPPTSSPSPSASPASPPATSSNGSGLRPFTDVVKDAKELTGYFTLWQQDEKVWLELKPDQIGVPYYLSINRSRALGEAAIYPFMVRGFIVEFRKIGNLVQMVARNTRYRATDGTPLALAVRQSFADSLLASAPAVSAAHPETHSVLVDANSIFLSDMPGAATELEAAFRASYSFDARNSSFTRVRATADMATFEVSAHYSLSRLPAPSPSPTPSPFRRPSTLPDPRSLFLGYHYSLAKLPDTPMQARKADQRIGHFTTTQFDFTNDLATSPRQYVVNRWRLEKKDPTAARSAPRQPIVFWLDRNIPLEYRETVRAGILEWNKAFERIGFDQAIRVEVQPDDAEFDTNDLRHASVRWYLDITPSALAIGPSRVDPRTGEILDADVVVSQGWTRLPRLLSAEQYPRPMPADASDEVSLCNYADEALEEASFAVGLLEARDALDPKGPEADAIVKATLKDVITHEVGHTLGLRHNFRASTTYSAARLSDAGFTRQNGLSGSVMDYNAWNIALDNERQGEYVMSTIGPYDYWAIEYAYKPIAPADEPQELDRIASRSTEPQLAYATDEESGVGPDAMDPEVNSRDLGSDPLAFARHRMQLSRELWDRWQSHTLSAGQTRDVLYRNVVSGFRQYTVASQVAAKYVGGEVYVRDVAGSPRASFTPVSAARQREALALVTESLFRPESFRFRPDFLARVAADPQEVGGGSRANFALASRVLEAQSTVLARLMSDAVAARLLDSVDKTSEPGRAIGLADVYDVLQAAVWSELKGTGDIPLLRRNLQREHLKLLAGTLIRPNAAAPPDARSLQRENARRLVAQLRQALAARPGLSKEARAHLSDSLNTLLEALKAPLQRNGV